MARKIIGIVSDVLDSYNPSDTHLRFILKYKDTEFRRAFGEFFKDHGERDEQEVVEYSESSIFPVEVNYAATIPQMANGLIVDKGITLNHFNFGKKNGVETVNMKFAIFSGVPLSDIRDGLNLLRQPLAGPRELFAFSQAFPGWQKQFPIACLSTAWKKLEGEYFLVLANGGKKKTGKVILGSEKFSKVAALLLVPDEME